MAAWTDEELTKLRAMYLDGMTSMEIGAQLGRSKCSVDNAISRNGLASEQRARMRRAEPTGFDTCTQRGDDNQIAFEGQSTKPIRSLEDLLEVTQVDTNTWKVQKWECKHWEMGYKDSAGEGRTLPLWSYNARFEPKIGWSPSEFLDRIRETLSKTPRTKFRRPKAATSGLLCELSIVDHHFGKLAWAPEVGEDYDLKIAEQRYTEAAEYLLHQAEQRKPSQILYVLGNDFYHVDQGVTGTTTAGTRQDVDGRWQKAYKVGLRCARDTALKAANIAPVLILPVPGNHDEEKIFTLGSTLEEIFADDKRIEVDNRPTLHKSHTWGKVFIGFYHGHKCNEGRRKTIHREFESHPGYADAAWREIHMGHLHSEHEMIWEYRNAQTLHKTIVRILPSLSGTDKWHKSMGYDAPRAAEMHVYDSSKGRIATEVFVP